jgi:hypothetical protein
MKGDDNKEQGVQCGKSGFKVKGLKNTVVQN